ncbi:MAG: hypothetical protein HRT43_15095, partial [Campylobacteraceae bacterium]|nr:hypothetical protein [Campylobacteraceae bacterium]
MSDQMSRKTKEEKVIEDAQDIFDDFKAEVKDESKELIAYEKLLFEYKKLTKRFNKILQMTDNISKNIIVHNDNLKDSVDYTIKTAREKILNNLAE